MAWSTTLCIWFDSQSPIRFFFNESILESKTLSFYILGSEDSGHWRIPKVLGINVKGTGGHMSFEFVWWKRGSRGIIRFPDSEDDLITTLVQSPRSWTPPTPWTVGSMWTAQQALQALTCPYILPVPPFGCFSAHTPALLPGWAVSSPWDARPPSRCCGPVDVIVLLKCPSPCFHFILWHLTQDPVPLSSPSSFPNSSPQGKGMCHPSFLSCSFKKKPIMAPTWSLVIHTCFYHLCLA